MTCPHCAVTIKTEIVREHLSRFAQSWLVECLVCPSCFQFTIWLQAGQYEADGPGVRGRSIWVPSFVKRFRAYPVAGARPVAPEVHAPIAADFTEACTVLPFSPKSSAALSRRCLQHVLHYVGIKKKNLHDEIEAAIASPGFPPTVADLLHTIRQVGNVAAHPQKEQNTGLIVDVEQGEAELLLDVLEELFDHYFVKPARYAAKKAAIAAKLAAAKGQAPPPAPSP
ncbi:MAG: DUF4145 domain-containing protein [Planctomycetota bacterium]|nr:DUF4145 domain-containing protein [Planctomycetota bacterium]